jgi:F0F1-type ATP synthase membrane subunit b/b'
VIAIDILALVDRLENLANEGWRVPFTVKTVINETAFFDIIDQMRVSVPEEVKRAGELLEDRERVLAAAAEDAERIRQEARQKAERLVDEHEITAAARAEAERIKTQAHQQADQFRKEAEDYALDALSDLESRLTSLLRQTSNGLTALRRRLAETVPENPEEPREQG